MEGPLSREELLKKIEDHENVSKVDTSEIKDMYELFCTNSYDGIFRGKDFNQPLNEWDVSNVNNMGCMFRNATSFNQPLNDWDVSNVEDMYCMFVGAKNFNQPLNDWNVSNVEDMDGMFWDALSFNQPLNDWNVSNVKTMEDMFEDAKNYTYSFKTWKLKSDCKNDDFLKGCNLWQLFNTVEDLPMQNGKRIDAGDRNIWKIL
jgi:surface protein